MRWLVDILHVFLVAMSCGARDSWLYASDVRRLAIVALMYLGFASLCCPSPTARVACRAHTKAHHDCECIEMHGVLVLLFSPCG